ncbi:pyruvate, water dikinase regulatory protein [Fodinicurvata sp. EGI_FJ10296]|uniref:pyruvate, water dikinase regulatory protein n=1 Tax=Fodinicurvata sp. EGI_FJ10296 TaxID=3231908 RepID=UPI0034519C95
MMAPIEETEDGRIFHVHLVSDATGETIQSVARACLAQFDRVHPVEHFWNMVRTGRQLDLILEDVRANPGLVIYTLVDDRLCHRLHDECAQLNLPCISVLDPVMEGLAVFLGMRGDRRPGRQHTLNDAYFDRMAAMEFALAHDDGQLTGDLHDADVILVGVSRTSKTPTCMYLANRGVKAANVPFVPGVPLTPHLAEVHRPLIVGLTKDPDSLVQIRKSRLLALNQGTPNSYIDPETVREEVIEARRTFSRQGWPVIDVSRRAIEETAAEIMILLSRRAQAGGSENQAAQFAATGKAQ